jgi:hypothetical protein
MSCAFCLIADTSFGHEKSPADPDKTHSMAILRAWPRYDDLAGLSVPRLKTFVCGDYRCIAPKKQEGKNLSAGL